MRTLNFPQKEIAQLSTEAVDRINSASKTDSYAKNGLLKAITRAYNNHNILTISPDDVMNNICCVWSKYLLLNAEKFRSQIVQHEGKKVLTVLTPQNTFWDDDLLHSHMKALSGLINLDNESVKWMDVRFSTSTRMDTMIRNVALLASQKEYYAYHSRTLCWLPRINLLGTEHDWRVLETKIEEMPTFDMEQDYWKTMLLWVISKFVAADEDDIAFWQAPLTHSPGGSGAIDYYTGWVTVFNPFNEKGDWGHRDPNSDYLKVKVADMLDLSVSFDIVCEDDSGVKHGTLKVHAGPTRMNASKELGLQVENRLHYVYTNDNEH